MATTYDGSGTDPIAEWIKKFGSKKKTATQVDTGAENTEEQAVQPTENTQMASPWTVASQAPAGYVPVRENAPGVTWNPETYTATLPGGFNINSDMGVMVNDRIYAPSNIFSAAGAATATQPITPVNMNTYKPYQEFMTKVNQPTSDLLTGQLATYDPSKVSMTEKVDKANTAFAPATETMQSYINSIPTADITKYTQLMNQVYAPAIQYLEDNRPNNIASQQKLNANIAMVDAAGQSAMSNMMTQRNQAMENAAGSSATRGMSNSPLALYAKSKVATAYAPNVENLGNSMATQKAGFIANAQDSQNSANNAFTTAIANAMQHSANQATSGYYAEDTRNSNNKTAFQQGMVGIKKAVGETATNLYNNDVSWKQGETGKVLGAQRDLSNSTATGALGLLQQSRAEEKGNNQTLGNYYSGIPKEIATEQQQTFTNQIATDANDRAQGAETRAQNTANQGNMTLGELGLDTKYGLPAALTLNQANALSGLQNNANSPTTKKANEDAIFRTNIIPAANTLFSQYLYNDPVGGKPNPHKGNPEQAVRATVAQYAGSGLSSDQLTELENILRQAAALPTRGTVEKAKPPAVPFVVPD